MKALARAIAMVIMIASSLAVQRPVEARNVITSGIERVSLATTGAEANEQSLDGSVSKEGRYVAFDSLASNLVPDDTNGTWDVFVRDRLLKTTERVSVDSLGRQGNGNSWSPSISQDGRYVAFVSAATNLVAGDGNGVVDIFLHDRVTRTTERISVSTTGGDANGASAPGPMVSADGRFVAFGSWASNLIDGETNRWADVFVRDRLLGTTDRAESPAVGSTGLSAMSSDGRFLVLSASVFAHDKVISEVFVCDRLIGTIEPVSIDEAGGYPNGSSFAQGISDDGRFISYYSDATNLVPGDNNGVNDVFVYDRHKHRTERLSVDSSGNEANGGSQWATIDGSGRFVVFWSAASNLTPGAVVGESHSNVFIHDRLTHRTRLVSGALDGGSPNGPSGAGMISADGHTVLFWSMASNLVPSDTNDESDLFVRRTLPVANW